LRKNAGIVQW